LADGVFNPFDDSTSNPYYDQAAGVPGLAPGRAVKLVRYQAGVIGSNLVVNPSFETNLDGWEATSASYPITRDTSTFYEGVASMLTTCNVTGAMTSTTGSRIDNTSVYRIPVTSGKTYLATAYVKNVSGNRTLRMRARTFSSATTLTDIDNVISNTTTNSSWTELSVFVTPSTGSSWLDLIFQTPSTGSIGDSFVVDAVSVYEYLDAGVEEPLFTGFVVNYDYQFTLGGLDTVTVFCVDNMYRLAQTFITGHNPTKEFTGARINAILDRTGVNYPTGAARNIATGTVELGGGGSYAIAEGTNVKAYFDFITYSAERGRIFIDRDGVLVSQDRIGAVKGAPDLYFKDDGTGAKYNDLEISFQAEDIINRVAITPAGGTQQLANDTASQTEFFIKALYIDGSLLHDNTAALDLANYLLEPNAEPRFTSVATFYGTLTTSQRDSAAILDIGDYIAIQKSILVGGSPTQLAQDLTVEGIEHRIDFARGHTSRYFTAVATVIYDLILDDPVYGIMDSFNVLG
jgi:hypothetical protein